MSASRGNPARQPSLREHNLGLTLAELADRGPASRARLASATGLTKATVSSLVDTLIAGGLVREVGPVREVGTIREVGTVLEVGPVREVGPVGAQPSGSPARLGRPGSPIALAADGPVGIGLEINVDYLATCTVDLAGGVRQRQLVTADFRRGRIGSALDRAAAALVAAVAAAREAALPVAGVAVGVPGLVDNASDDGPALLRLAPNLGWRDVAILDELRTRAGAALPAGLAMTLDNEANRAALGELWCGGHQSGDGTPLRTFVYVSGEIGVGAGLVVDGQLFRGLRGFSGEIGHLPIAAVGITTPCSCGAYGCLEQLAGQEAILRAAGLQAAGVRGTGNGNPDGPVGELVRLAGLGDPAALAAIADAGTALGTGISAVLNLVDADTVVLGGLYARLAPWLVPSVEREIAVRALAASWAPVQVLVSRLGGEAAVRGAAMSVVRGVIEDPAGYLAEPAPAPR